MKYVLYEKYDLIIVLTPITSDCCLYACLSAGQTAVYNINEPSVWDFV